VVRFTHPTSAMRIVINHLTRMHGSHVCTAGVDVETRRHVRPVLAHEAMPFYLLARYGGAFDMARLLDLGAARPQPEPPHVEDHVFVPSRVRPERTVAGYEFWTLLEELSRPRLADLFGASLRPCGSAQHCGTDVGQGLASLGCLRVATPPELYVLPRPGGKPQIRMRFGDGQMEADASVTDLRLYASDHATPDAAVMRALSERMRHSGGIILAVGLTRKYRSSETQPYAHWLQVNNIHLREEPIWQLR
jgi:hypothetical protein